MKYFYFASNIFDDKRIKYIDSLPKGTTIFWIWFNLVSFACKCGEKENLKNCLKRKNLPAQLRNDEFLETALEILRMSNLLDIESLKDIIRFEDNIDDIPSDSIFDLTGVLS